MLSIIQNLQLECYNLEYFLCTKNFCQQKGVGYNILCPDELVSKYR